MSTSGGVEGEGIVQAVVAGTNIAVNSADPANPVVATSLTPAFTTINTAPVASHIATPGFGSLVVGTPKQNTLGYDVLITVSIAVTVAVSGSVNVGVGATATPTVDAVTDTITATGVVSFAVIVPKNYYLSVTLTGTLTLGTPTLVVCPV